MIFFIFIWLQHDKNFAESASKFKDKEYEFLRELVGAQFFVRRFNNDTNLTAERLRLEEEKIVSSLYSNALSHKSDYHRLCGGHKLVGYMICIDSISICDSYIDFGALIEIMNIFFISEI